jgi:hypothetical protein
MAKDARRWRRWGESEARAVLGELARSEESEAAFARRRGIGRQRLRYWRQRLAVPQQPAAFVAVELPAAASLAKEIAIRVGDVSVCVREDFDVEHLARIVEALGRRIRSC